MTRFTCFTRFAGLIGLAGLAAVVVAGCASSDGQDAPPPPGAGESAAPPPSNERSPDAIGGVVGKMLGDVGLEVDVDDFSGDDRRRHAEASYQAFLAEPVGGKRSWSNPATGNHGTTTITGLFRNVDGMACKRFTRNTILNDQTYIADGTACEQPDGTWNVVDLHPRNDGQPVNTD
jgi:surface antigen